MLNIRLYWILLVPEIHTLPLFPKDHGVLGEIASPPEHFIVTVRLISAASPSALNQAPRRAYLSSVSFAIFCASYLRLS